MKTIVNLVKQEGKRFLKYGAVGGIIGMSMGGASGYVIVNEFSKNAEIEIHQRIEENFPQMIQPVFKFIVNRLISRAKNEGIESCAFYGGWFGISTGFSLGFTRVVLGTGVSILKYARGLVSKPSK